MQNQLLAISLLTLSSCASNPGTRQQQIDISVQAVRDQISILDPLLDEKASIYLQTATEVLNAVVENGDISWASAVTAIDEIEPTVISILTEQLGKRDALIAVAAFRSALRTVQLLTASPG